MTSKEFWKNFNIGREVQLSGNFIYDGILVFEQMEHFHNEDEIFEFLYFISVGLERLMKANIVLIEHSEEIDQNKLEESLITHNHSDLINRIIANRNLTLGKVHNAFIQMLTKFYKTYRYDRFNLQYSSTYDKERSVFVDFLNNHYSSQTNNTEIKTSQNNERIKKFIGNIISKIVTQLYSIIKSESHRLGLYTYEVRTYSKAYKIFLEEDFTFKRERILQKEILIYLLQNNEDTGFKEHINTHLPALEFENGYENDYVKPLIDLSKCHEVLDELEAIYEDIDKVGHRIGAINAIGSDIHFIKDIEEDFNPENE